MKNICKLIFIFLSLSILHTLGWPEYFEISNYSINAKLSPEGKLIIQETITVLFYEPRHGIYRTIPTKWESEDISHKFRFEKIKTKEFPYKISWEGNLLKIRIGSPSKLVEGIQTYTITYEVPNPILAFRDQENKPWQAFYWNLIGTDWEVPIRNASFEVKIEKEWQPYFIVLAGKRGSTDTNRVKVTYTPETQTIYGKLSGELSPNEGITILCAFPDGFWDVESQKTFWEKLWGKFDFLNSIFLFIKEKYLSFLNLLSSIWKRYSFFSIFIISIFYIIFLFYLWLKFGKDKGFVKVVHFYPPSELTPAEAGMLIDNKADARDVIATIFQWAVQGNISIEEEKTSSGEEFILHKIYPLTSPRQYEILLWNGIFSSSTSEGNKVKLSSLEYKFAKTFNEVIKMIKTSVTNKSLYKPHSLEISEFMLFINGFILFLGLFLALFLELYILLILAPVLAVITYFFAKIMPGRTEKGQKLYEQLVGFRDFVKRAKWPQIETLIKEDPLYFDKTLPYAIVFGLEKKWISKFSPILQSSPNWYHTKTTTFNPKYLSKSIHRSISQIGTALSSSSGVSRRGRGSSFGGRGYSGGGGGGGGGRSW